MKNLTFIACLCFATAVYAGNDKRPSRLASGELNLEQRIQEPEIKLIEVGDATIQQIVKKEKQPTNSLKVPAFLSKTMLNEKELREMAAYSVTEHLVSVVSSQYSTGINYSKHYFEFEKDTHLPMQRTNSMWDAKTNSWVPEELYRYTWDEDGYCLTQEVYYPKVNMGTRYVYTYNEQKLGNTLTVYKFDISVSDDWYVTEKGEYEYDDKGDMTQEATFQWEDGKWEPVIKTLAADDEKHRMTLFEPYYWDGSEWVGNGDKKEYAYDKWDNVTYNAFYIWGEVPNDWFKCQIIESEYTEDNQPSQQLWRYWNRKYQNWTGCDEWWGTMFNNKLTNQYYDEKGREIRSQFNVLYTPVANEEEAEYSRCSGSTDEWTEIENGLTQRVRTATVYPSPMNPDLDGEKVTDIATWHYDSMGNQVYFFEIHGGVDYETDEYTYENGDLVRSYKYVFKSGLAQIIKYTYDEYHNVLTQQSGSKNEQGNNDENWTNGNRFEYVWDTEHGVILDKKAFFWNGVEYVPNWGQAASYDFDADMSQVNMWPGGDTEYKLLETRNYANNDGEWDWVAFKYYYSPAPTGIENQVSDGDIKVYPNPVVDMLYINSQESAEINLYNMQGAKLLNTNEKKIDMTGYPTGLYIIDVNGTKTKILKK